MKPVEGTKVKKLIRASQDSDNSLVRDTGNIIAAMEQLSESVIGDGVREAYQFLTDQEFSEFIQKCETAAGKILELAQGLNDELLHYLNVRYSDHPDYSGTLGVGPMGDI